MCCLSILGVGRLRWFGLVVVRVAKLIVVALVVVGIDEHVGAEGMVMAFPVNKTGHTNLSQ